MPTSASAPTRNTLREYLSGVPSPPIRRMSCSPVIAWMTMPAARKRSALKNACVIRWNIALE